MRANRTQFGLPANTASPGQHASRPAVTNLSNPACTEKSPTMQNPSLRNQSQSQIPTLENSLHFASEHATTVGKRTDENHFLTVREVAELLHVPSSWVYGRMRKRPSERLPGYRLGKYWRFREPEIIAWVECHKQDSPSA